MKKLGCCQLVNLNDQTSLGCPSNRWQSCHRLGHRREKRRTKKGSQLFHVLCLTSKESLSAAHRVILASQKFCWRLRLDVQWICTVGIYFSFSLKSFLRRQLTFAYKYRSMWFRRKLFPFRKAPAIETTTTSRFDTSGFKNSCSTAPAASFTVLLSFDSKSRSCMGRALVGTD